MHLLFDMIFGCAHKNTTFPLSPFRRAVNPAGRRGTYVVCLDCGKEFDYNWQEMRIGDPVPKGYVSSAAIAGVERGSVN